MRFVAHPIHRCLGDPCAALWEPIQKAGRGRPSAREFQIINSVADKMNPLIRVGFKKAIQVFRDNVDFKTFVVLLRAGKTDEALASIPWGELPKQKELDDLRELLARGVADSGAKSEAFFLKSLPKIIPHIEKPTFSFSTENPGIKRWVNSHVGDLIQNVTDEAKNAVTNTVRRSLSVARTPREITPEIERTLRHTIGLDERQANAVMNYRAALEKQGISSARLEKLVTSFEDRQFNTRALRIARTEAQFAANQGQRQVWEQAADQGLIDRATIKRQWVVTPDEILFECPICRPLQGQIVGFNDAFINSETGDSVEEPPAHPSCRCAVRLVFPGEET